MSFLDAQAKPPFRLGSNDIDAIVRAVTRRWPSPVEQRRRLGMLWKLIDYGHRVDELHRTWDYMSPRQRRLDPATAG